MQHKFILMNLTDTQFLAEQIAGLIVPNFVVTLSGNLGAGKTTLTRAILRSMGIRGSVKSPTFTLVEPYPLNDTVIYHFDLYRFSDPEEWFDAGFDEYFVGQPYICFIEWAEKARGLIPQIDWQINLELVTEQRELIITALTEKGFQCLKRLKQLISTVAI